MDKARQMCEKVIALQPKDVAEESNTGSLAGKGLADIARENLKLPDAREAELAAGQKAAASAPQAVLASPAPMETAPATGSKSPFSCGRGGACSSGVAGAGKTDFLQGQNKRFPFSYCRTPGGLRRCPEMAQPFPPQQECPGKDEGDGELPCGEASGRSQAEICEPG